jgi:hypothetical protein
MRMTREERLKVVEDACDAFKSCLAMPGLFGTSMGQGVCSTLRSVEDFTQLLAAAQVRQA